MRRPLDTTSYLSNGYTVTLTPPSADLERDVIAQKSGVGTIRVLDQVRQYRPERSSPTTKCEHFSSSPRPTGRPRR